MAKRDLENELLGVNRRAFEPLQSFKNDDGLSTMRFTLVEIQRYSIRFRCELDDAATIPTPNTTAAPSLTLPTTPTIISTTTHAVDCDESHIEYAIHHVMDDSSSPTMFHCSLDPDGAVVVDDNLPNVLRRFVEIAKESNSPPLPANFAETGGTAG